MMGLGINLEVGGGVGLAGPPALFDEQWLTAVSAPISSPHTAEPGPGGLAITGTDQSISGNRIICPTNVANQGLLASASLAFAADRAFVIKNFRLTGTPSATGLALGLVGSAALSLNTRAGFYLNNTGLFNNFNNQSGQIIAAVPTSDVDYDYAIVERAAGSFLLQKLSADTNWTLLFFDDVNTTTPLWPHLRYTSCPLQSGRWRMFDGCQLTPLYSAASGAVGTVTLSTADYVAKLICTGTGTQSIRCRIQDANNYWRVERSATLLRIIQTIAGVDQSAAASASITATANERLMVACDVQTIRAIRYLSTGATQIMRAITNASGFVSATGIAIGDEVNYSNFEVFDRVQSLAL